MNNKEDFLCLFGSTPKGGIRCDIDRRPLMAYPIPGKKPIGTDNVTTSTFFNKLEIKELKNES